MPGSCHFIIGEEQAACQERLLVWKIEVCPRARPLGSPPTPGNFFQAGYFRNVFDLPVMTVHLTLVAHVRPEQEIAALLYGSVIPSFALYKLCPSRIKPNEWHGKEPLGWLSVGPVFIVTCGPSASEISP